LLLLWVRTEIDLAQNVADYCDSEPNRAWAVRYGCCLHQGEIAQDRVAKAFAFAFLPEARKSSSASKEVAVGPFQFLQGLLQRMDRRILCPFVDFEA
jgi:hypothetical protein